MQGRETRRNRARSATTHRPADLQRDAAAGTTVSHAREMSALSYFSHAPWVEQGAMANPCTIPAVLHHKSQVVCTKKKKVLGSSAGTGIKKWRPLHAAQMKQSSPAVSALPSGEAPCLLATDSQPSSLPSPPQLQQFPEVLKLVRTCDLKKPLMPGKEVIITCHSSPVT